MAYVMTVQKFIDRLHLALNRPTLYVMGGFGAPLNSANKARYINKNAYNKKRKKLIMAASDNTFAFDCVNLGKGILWGWSANAAKNNGGAVYASNGVPDTNADGMYKNYCYDKSTDFRHLVRGEFLWMSGHCGYYIGDGLAVECTPKWKNKVQITAVGNIGKKAGYNTRTWKGHGKLPFLDYSAVENAVPVFRLYDGKKLHYYTESETKRAELIANGWTYEKVGWYAPKEGGLPVFCVVNPNNGDRLLTTNTKERDDLVRLGLRLDGVTCRSAPVNGHPVFRLYNPNTGEHFYTTDANEKDILLRKGMKGEGIAFYAAAKG